MAANKVSIKENLFQKSHADSMQALIWALTLLKEKHVYLSPDEKKAITELGHARFDQETSLAAAYQSVLDNLENPVQATIIKTINKLRLDEEAYQEDLARKATRHKLSLFFAFFFALGCGTTVAGSNFLMGASYGWTSNMGFLMALGLTALPIIACVSLANWWMVVRLVPDIENANEEPYLKVRKAMIALLGKRFGEYSKYNALFYAIGIFFYEIWNALAYNFKQTVAQKEEAKNRTLKESVKLYFWRTVVFFGALIYAFFAYAATYKLGMGLFELFSPGSTAGAGLATAGSWGLPVIMSAVAGIFMAIPTYMSMKTLYIRMASVWMDQIKGSTALIENIPGANSPDRWWFGKPLLFWFKIAAVAIIISIAFTTYAATDPLGAFFQGMGMAAGIAGPLSIVTVAIAFIGNIPFYWHCTASTFAQNFDPREQLNASNSKLFPYVRFWNAVLNSIPVLVGVLAVFGVIGLTGPFAPLIMFLPIVLNVAVGAIASYGANCGGSKSMYQFDPAKQISEYQLAQLDALSFEQKIAPPKDLEGDNHLLAEYFGAYRIMYKKNAARELSPLASALQKVILNNKDKYPLSELEEKMIHEAARPNAFTVITRSISRLFSAFYHDDRSYVSGLFGVDYLHRIQKFGSPALQERLEKITHPEGKPAPITFDSPKTNQEAYQLFMHHNDVSLTNPISYAMADYLTAPFRWILPSGQITQYEYLTEDAPDEVRKNYLIQVLEEYARQEQDNRQKTVAETLISIFNGKTQQSIKESDFGLLNSGVIGRVFQLAAGIPELKTNLKTALDLSVSKKRECEGVHENPSKVESRPRRSSWFAYWDYSLPGWQGSDKEMLSMEVSVSSYTKPSSY